MEFTTTLDSHVLTQMECLSPEIILQLNELNRTETKDKPVISAPETSELKEISDAILEVVEEVDIESKIANARQKAVEERLMYAAIESQQKGLDYSKLHYGKIAQPLAVRWDYSDYEKQEQMFTAKETLTYEEVEEIVHEKAWADLFNSGGHALIKAQTDERFQYWRLFNMALKEVKYELAFV